MLLRLMKFVLWIFIVAGTSGQSLTNYRQTTIAEVTSQRLLTSQMRPIPLTSVAIGGNQVSQDPRHQFLVQGGLHGNETLTVEFVEWLSERVKQGRSPLNQLPPGSTIDFLPQANPDAFGVSRYNSNRVNLNRNFGVLWGLSLEPNGDKAFSEPETQAIRMLMQSRQYLAAVDIHGYVNC
jgi:predicted deacylase